jgi:hypothetical protein
VTEMSDHYSPKDFLSIPCEELAVVAFLGIVDDREQVLYRELSREELTLGDISLEWP